MPAYINYQGRVTDSSGEGLGTGTPVNRKMIFRLFDAATGGNRVWSEEQTVTIANGEFSVLLGNGINATYNSITESPRPLLTTVFSSADRYLELVVDDGNGSLNTSDTPIAPRQRLTSTAFAMRAATADGVAAGTDLSLSGTFDGLGVYTSARKWNGQTIDGPVLYGGNGGALGSNQNGTNNTALRWDAAGNVGIGNFSPSEKLDVSGNAKVSGNFTVGGDIVSEGLLWSNGIRMPGSSGANSNFVGTPGNFIAFGTANFSEDFLSYKQNVFYLRDSPDGGDSTQPSLDVGGNITASNLNTGGALTAGSISSSGTVSAGSFNAGGGSISTTGTVTAGSVSTGTITASGGIGGTSVLLSGNVHFLDTNHGVGKYSTFGGVGLDGPVLFGYQGGALGSTNGEKKVALTWDDNKNVKIAGGLQVNGGSISASGNVTAGSKSVVVGEENLRIVRGTVAGNGTIAQGGVGGPYFSVSGANEYTITFNTAFSGIPTVTATSSQAGYLVITINSVSTTGFKVQSRLSDNNNFAAGQFSFIAVGPR